MFSSRFTGKLSNDATSVTSKLSSSSLPNNSNNELNQIAEVKSNGQIVTVSQVNTSFGDFVSPTVQSTITPNAIDSTTATTTSTTTNVAAASTSSSTTIATLNGSSSSPVDELEEVKIQPNQLYASWRLKLPASSSSSVKQNVGDEDTSSSSSSGTSSDSYSNRDRVESILDGIISVLDKRVNSELPSEPRKESASFPVSNFHPQKHHEPLQRTQERKAFLTVSLGSKGSRSEDQGTFIRGGKDHEYNQNHFTYTSSTPLPLISTTTTTPSPSQSYSSSSGTLATVTRNVKGNTYLPLNEKTSRKDDSSLNMNNKNNSDEGDESEEFILPPIATGYISNLEANGDLNRNGHSKHSTSTTVKHNNNNNNSGQNTYLYYVGNNHSNGQKVKGTNSHLPSSQSHLNSSPSSYNSNTNPESEITRVKVSSKIGFSTSNTQLGDHRSNGNDIKVTHLPKPLSNNGNISSLVSALASSSSPSHSPSALFMVEPDDSNNSGEIITGKRENNHPIDGKKNPPSASAVDVEIITAKTPFLEANLSDSDSFLINLAPSTLKFGSVDSANSPSSPPSPSSSSSSNGSSGQNIHYSLSPVKHSQSNNQPSILDTITGHISPINKPAPSYPSYYGAHGQWRIVTANNRGPVYPGNGGNSVSPQSKQRSNDDVMPDALTKRTGHYYSQGEKIDQQQQGIVNPTSSTPSGSFYSSPSGTGSPKVISFISNGGISPSTSFMRRKGTTFLAIQPISASSSPSQATGKFIRAT